MLSSVGDSGPSRRPWRQVLGDVSRRAAARIGLATLLLVGLEVCWARSLQVPLDLPRVVALLATLALLVGCAQLVGALLLGLTAALGRRAAALVDGLLAAPVAWQVSGLLFSGGWISTVRFSAVWRVLLGLALLASAVLAGRWARSAWRTTSIRARVSLGALALVCLLAANAADNLVEVQHYLPFHLTLAAVMLWAALVLALVVWPATRPAPAVPGRAALLLLALLACAWLAVGRGAPADDLVRYTHGLMPKARRAQVFLVEWIDAARERDGQAARPGAVAQGTSYNLLLSPERLVDASWSTDGQLTVAVGAPSALVVGGQGGTLSQRVLTPLRPGARLAASVRLKPDPSAVGLSATLALELPGADGGHEISLDLAPGWNQLAFELETGADRPIAFGSEALSGETVLRLEPADMRPESGLAWLAAVPPELELWADNRRADRTPGLVLLEDGVPLGPGQPVHDLIRQHGQGSYSVWSRSLFFSTSDESDPRHNGRRYELALPAPDRPARLHPAWTLALHGEGAVQVEGASLVDLGATSSADLGRALAEEFVLVPTPGPAAEAVRAATRNVIVVLLDALRDDHVGPREDGSELTPELDAVAADGVRFACTYAPSDYTGRSVPCIATSLPLEVTLRTADRAVPLVTWLSTLADQGYRTFNNGSDYIQRRYAHLLLPDAFGAQQVGSVDPKAESLCDEVLAFVADGDERPFAVYTHWSYAHVGRFREMADEYAAMVAKCDAGLGRLVAGLRAQGEWDRTLLVVTADHGYALGEGNRYLGAQGCAELSLRVPLILHVPGLARRGLRPAVPVSNLSLGPTVLDVLAPQRRHVLGAGSLLPLLLEPDGQAGGPVFASTGDAWMTRDGGFKLAEERATRTSALFDLERDPEERRPLDDPRQERRLRLLREREQERQSRLAQALVSGSGAALAPDVLGTFAREDLDADAVTPLLLRLWGYDESTREYVLSECYRRGIDGLGPILDGVRRPTHERADDLLLAVRVWAGGQGALDELAGRLADLHPDALAWFAAMLVRLRDEQVAPLAPALVELTRARWATGPAFDSDDGRLVALLCRGLGARLPASQLEALKDVTVELFDAWSADPDSNPYFASLEDRKFMRRKLLDVFRQKPVPGDLARADRLVRNRDFVVCMPAMCRRLGTQEAKDWLLRLLRDWEGVGEDPPDPHGSWTLPILNSFDDAAFRAEAQRIVRQRFPEHPSLDEP